MYPYRRASEAGRRFALDRKFRLNTEAYGGKVKLLTLTPAGEDLCPFGDEYVERVPGEPYRQVEWAYRVLWNHSAQKRATRLFEAAQRSADRVVRKMGWKGQLPRQISSVKSIQKRGLFHFHWELPYETHFERMWSKHVERFMDNARKVDKARWPDESVRRLMIEREYLTGEVVRGFYGFGFIHGGNPAGRSSKKAAGYMAKNAAHYMAKNVHEHGRHYVNVALTRKTGVTMRALRSCNWLFVRRKLIDSGELVDSWIPSHWSEAQTASTLRVWSLLNPSAAP